MSFEEMELNPRKKTEISKSKHRMVSDYGVNHRTLNGNRYQIITNQDSRKNPKYAFTHPWSFLLFSLIYF